MNSAISIHARGSTAQGFGAIAILPLLCLLATGAGCKTRAKSEVVFGGDRPYQSPDFSLAEYKSPEEREVDQQRSVSIAMAISGGGFRATNFGLGVMMALEELEYKGEVYDLLKEVDYYSTVSGGGLAAGIHVSTLVDHYDEHGTTQGYSLNHLISKDVREVRRNAERGYHNDVFRSFVDPRMIGEIDRGDALESEFDCKVFGAETREGERSITLGDIFQPVASTEPLRAPMWIANATIYENGGIFQFTPSVLREYGISTYVNRLKRKCVGGDFESVPISVGAKASASFPALLGATTLGSTSDPANPHLHLLDGGLADNIGVETALQALLKAKGERKVLIVVDAYSGETEPFSKTGGSPRIPQVLWKVMNIGLDGARLRTRPYLKRISQHPGFGSGGLEVVYLSFDELDSELRQEVREIDTDFNISGCEQKALFRAGAQVVEARRPELMQAVLNVN